MIKFLWLVLYLGVLLAVIFMILGSYYWMGITSCVGSDCHFLDALYCFFMSFVILGLLFQLRIVIEEMEKE